uniref:Uncharacterized protein n=1 Tax=Branchiostoma floridae TaxID=7739 RepID=C3YU61_BRAFL|eukprot:XP_002600326.1 hypothetical protein BRAFLDRAFT_66828 [Branchiostoma floridae]
MGNSASTFSLMAENSPGWLPENATDGSPRIFAHDRVWVLTWSGTSSPVTAFSEVAVHGARIPTIVEQAEHPIRNKRAFPHQRVEDLMPGGCFTTRRWGHRLTGHRTC